MGYGWMPEYLTTGELMSKTLVTLNCGDEGGVHTFQPCLYHRDVGSMGKSLAIFVAALARRSAHD